MKKVLVAPQIQFHLLCPFCCCCNPLKTEAKENSEKKMPQKKRLRVMGKEEESQR